MFEPLFVTSRTLDHLPKTGGDSAIAFLKHCLPGELNYFYRAWRRPVLVPGEGFQDRRRDMLLSLVIRPWLALTSAYQRPGDCRIPVVSIFLLSVSHIFALLIARR